MGSALMGSLQIIVFFDRGTLGTPVLTYFCLRKSAGAYLFPQSVKISYFCSSPISVDPICPQPNPLCLTHCTHVLPCFPEPRSPENR